MKKGRNDPQNRAETVDRKMVLFRGSRYIGGPYNKVVPKGCFDSSGVRAVLKEAGAISTFDQGRFRKSKGYFGKSRSQFGSYLEA